MATSAEIETDRLSSLPDALLVTILSLLPTRCAARTSVLCRRFRHLWEASPSLELVSTGGDREPELHNFIVMADRALLRRDPSHSLRHLRLDTDADSKDDQMAAFLPSLLIKARSLGLLHLAVDWFPQRHLLPVLTAIFSISSLESLSFFTFQIFCLDDSMFSSGITLTCLKTLSLDWIYVNPATNLNRLLSELCSLENLHLRIWAEGSFCISSKTIRKLELILSHNYEIVKFVGLSIPSLELLKLKSCSEGIITRLPPIHGQLPLLRKAVLTHDNICGENAAAQPLSSISRVEELSLDIRGSYVMS